MFGRWRVLSALVLALCVFAVIAQQARAQEGETYQVQPGDTCWGVAERFFGNGADWNVIRNANPAVVRQVPNNNCLWYPGELTKIPPFTSAGTVPMGNVLNPASPSIPTTLSPATNDATASTSSGFGSWDLHLSWPFLIICSLLALLVGILFSALAIGYALGRGGLTGSFNGTMTYNFNHTFRQEGTTRHDEHLYIHDMDVEEHEPATPSTNGAKARPERVPVEPEH